MRGTFPARLRCARVVGVCIGTTYFLARGDLRLPLVPLLPLTDELARATGTEKYRVGGKLAWGRVGAGVRCPGGPGGRWTGPVARGTLADMLASAPVG
jgi:hypothetical protein